MRLVTVRDLARKLGAWRAHWRLERGSREHPQLGWGTRSVQL